jgi:hypothetical protein
MVAIIVLGFVSIPMYGQNPDVDRDYLFTNIFAGGGIGSDGTVQPSSAQAGGTAGFGTISSKVGGLGFQEFLESGLIGPLATRNTPTGFVGFDLGSNVLISHTTRSIPFAAAGYSYIFLAGNAINYGIGIDHYYKSERAIRLEVRDYFTVTATHQHNVAVRLAWNFGVHDD